MVLKCRTTSLWVDSYESQVRLVSGDYPSSGTLEIYYNRIWGNVCNSKLDQNAADSACRQMGYTNAKAFTTTATQSSDSVWLNGVECGSSSCVCLNRCFDNTPTAPVTCDNRNYVSINCTFDASIAETTNQQGNRSTCSSPGTCNGSPRPGGNTSYVISVPVLILILGFLLVVTSVVTLVVCFMVAACPLAKWRGRRSYGTVN